MKGPPTCVGVYRIDREITNWRKQVAPTDVGVYRPLQYDTTVFR